MDFESIIKKIKEKKELSGLSDEVISELVQKYFSKNRLSIKDLKPSELKILVKDIRSQLRNYAGRFQIYSKEWKKRDELLEKNDILSLLKTHTSTKERIDFYPNLKEIISSLNVRSILDLGCGVNPLVLSAPGIKYYAADINTEELALVDKFFKKNNIDGKTFVCDLRRIDSCSFPKEADLCLIFKVLDILENKGHKLAENIISSINAKYFLISFSTRTISGRPMLHERRLWIEKILSRLNFSFEAIRSENEIFYLARRLS